MSLYTNYRPKDLTQVWGNEDTCRALQTILNRPLEDVPHAFLLHGPSGCGKTTMARIIASSLGCAPEDYREVDSADFRGIDSIRDIRKQMRLRPMAGPCRVWLLDECHKLSNDAQNALLKALEDTPAHVYFILATTDPQYLIKTIQNRCTTLRVESLSVSEIAELVTSIAEAEGKPITRQEAQTIATKANGSPRAALVSLDAVIDVEGEERAKAIERIKENEAQAIELCRALADKKGWKVLAGVLQKLDEDPESLRRMVLGYFNTILLKDGTQHAAWVIECFSSPFYDTGKAGLSYACYRVLNP